MVLILLISLAVLMLSEAWLGIGDNVTPLFQAGMPRIVTGLLAGFGIGIVAALLGVAGGELLIPTIILLYGVDIKLAGSLSLMVSLPTMLVGFARYSGSSAFGILHQEQGLFVWMVAGSIIGSGLGALLVGLIPSNVLITLLGIILLISAVKTFQHPH